MTAKLALIDPDLLVRLLNERRNANPTPPANPTLREIGRIDNDMRTLLTDTKGDASTRLKKYNELLTEYDTQTDNFNKTPLGPPMRLAEESRPPRADNPDRWVDFTIDSLPKTFKRTGELLMRHIKKSGDKLGWDAQGRVVYDGVAIPDSNIVDLINSVVRKRKGVPAPAGTEAFASALTELNTPAELAPGRSTTVERTSKRSAKKKGRQMDLSSYEPQDATPSRTKSPRKRSRSYELPAKWEKFI